MGGVESRAGAGCLEPAPALVEEEVGMNLLGRNLAAAIPVQTDMLVRYRPETQPMRPVLPTRTWAQPFWKPRTCTGCP